ncbi:MAG TPA: TetR/AcrR family transcriptional regulator [Rhizomicrobium sp.]|jgi:AcrR family transcriptional regulator|nr:TetR/AcrR family transcriptional regulator [Rhizomicrobium sp.]
MPKILSTAEVSDFRERLCEAAEDLYAQHGMEGFTLRNVARELGVSPMTPYRYFHDKDEMLAAVRARAFTRFSEALETAFASGGDAGSRADAAGEAYVRFALEQPADYKLMFDVSQPGDEKYPELNSAAGRATQTLTRHVFPLIEAGFLEGDPDLIGHVFWATLHGTMMLHLAGKLGTQYDYRKILDAAFTALIRGFAPKGK